MAKIPGTISLTGVIAPNDELDTYPVQEDIWGKGGYRVVDSIASRDAVTDLRRKVGMLVHVVSDNTTYQLVGGIENTNWVEYITDSGGGSGDANYTHTQGVPAGVWNVTHGLNKVPSVTVLDSAKNEVIGDYDHIDANNTTLTFSASFSGKAYFN